MAVCSLCLLPSVISARRYPLINRPRAHFSTSTNHFATATGDLHGSALRISQICPAAAHLPVEEENPPSSRIFVKGLSRSTSEGYLLKQFSLFGEISKVKIVTSRGSKESLGMAYIWYSCKDSAELALKEMNGKFVDGRFIAVMISRPEAPTKHTKFVPYRF
ncbi:hypothetical protein KSP40_PGU016754 [Platanthera guangdongensis]|uniref:RRM domain-containing protein n=1 Tax=Platanthera guangdongensis TaxID=2320717 RepID=A0ABR2M8U5_9ASPA